MKSNILQVLRLFGGMVLLLIGIISLLLPLLPGWVLIFGGVLLLFPESGKKIVARVKEWLKKRKENKVN